jgi:hypothetical protein
MRRVFELVAKAAPTDATVLILGENGTGKELVARALHRRSARAEQVFMGVDLGAVSETLIESELFGHKKGAFTGATDHRVGRFQAAAGGTLFLDELGNLPRHLQPKLLTALERREVIPVGANSPVAIDVRVISATNTPRADLGTVRCSAGPVPAQHRRDRLPPLRHGPHPLLAVPSARSTPRSTAGRSRRSPTTRSPRSSRTRGPATSARCATPSSAR